MRLEHLMRDLKNHNSRGLALDIDLTLSTTNQDYFTLLSERFPFPDNPGVERLMALYRYTDTVPQWQGEEAQRAMHEFRVSDQFQRDLGVVPDAPEEVRRIHTELIPIVAYVTTHPTCVLEGTAFWLREKGFPYAPILACQEGIPHKSRSLWKASVLFSLRERIIGFVDDDPDIKRELPGKYAGTAFLFGPQHQEITGDYIHIPTWKEAYSIIKKHNPLAE